MTEVRNNSYMFFDRREQEKMHAEGWRVGLSNDGLPLRWMIRGVDDHADATALFHVKTMAAAGSALHQHALKAIAERNRDWTDMPAVAGL